MTAPELSVVMGVFNNADTLPAALESILSQEGVDLEFIVVNDGSTDGSAAILDKAAARDPRLKILHKDNAGLTRALIDGCAMASAPWIARQDADDVSLPGRLKAQLARARQADAPVLVSCRAECVSPDGDVLYVTDAWTDPEAARRRVLREGRTLSAHGAMCFRQDAYRSVGGYRAEFYYAQDVDLSIRLAESGPVAGVADVLYRFQFAPGTISGRINRWPQAFHRLSLRSQAARAAGRSDRAVLQQALRLGARCAQSRRVRVSRFPAWVFMGSCLLANGNPVRAAPCFRAALKLRPWSMRAWVRWLQARRQTTAPGACRNREANTESVFRIRPARGMRERLLIGVGTAVRRLPNFRGKVRALLALHRFLGLETRHVVVPATLHHPVRYRANLDLFCLHERMAYFMDRYEPGTVEFLARLWRKGETFIDVGANVGLIAIPFTLLCEARAGRPLTYCIEAVAANAKSLAEHVVLNGLEDRLKIIETAVGECDKQVEIQIEKNQKTGTGTGTANILAAGSGYRCERIPLTVTTIDRLVAEGRLPHDCGLMKIDTDGYDLFVLMGARRLLASARPVVFGEFMEHCLRWHGQSIHDVAAYLRPFRYKVFVRSAGWSFVPLEKGFPYVQDALCIPEEKCERASWCLA
ncbi:MAG TPA: FkbM family methyltransferase [Kiritimatiellia bacterium]|nr:FkbM family methyltransferase [Kiritimatiellia bacterium]